jgi:hypothetical protein
LKQKNKKKGKCRKKCQEGLTRNFNWYMDFSLVQVIEEYKLMIGGIVSIFKYVINYSLALK